MKKKVTIYDIARQANVTAATVSRVINRKNNVSAQTREKVMRIVEEMDFYPSTIASALSGKRAQEVGIISTFFLGDFFLKILESLHAELKRYDVILYNAQTPASRQEVVRRIVNEGRLSGMIFLSSPILKEEEALLKKSPVPAVLLECNHPDYPSIYYDNVIGAYKAVHHLIELGHEKVAIITGKPEPKVLSPIGKERLAGYKMALSLARIPVREDYVMLSEWTREDAYLHAKRRLSMKDRPSAIFAASDYQAVGALRAAQELKLNVPRDISIMGYDNTEISEILALTTVAQRYDVMARNAAQSLLEEIRTGVRSKEQIVLQSELIIRSTTAKPAG